MCFWELAFIKSKIRLHFDFNMIYNDDMLFEENWKIRTIEKGIKQ